MRVFSGYVREIEAKPSATEWGAKMPIGNMMAEFSNSAAGGGWIHSVSFSHDGSKLAWVGHDSSINVGLPSTSVFVPLPVAVVMIRWRMPAPVCP